MQMQRQTLTSLPSRQRPQANGTPSEVISPEKLGQVLGKIPTPAQVALMPLHRRIDVAVNSTRGIHHLGGSFANRGNRTTVITKHCEAFGFTPEDVEEDLRVMSEGAQLGAKERIGRRLASQR